MPPWLFSSTACRAYSFESYLLALDNETLVQVLCHGHRNPRQTVFRAALGARKVRMALAGRTFIGQFKMPGPLLYIGFVNNSCFYQRRKSPINRCFVEPLQSYLCRDFVLSQRCGGFKQDVQDCNPALCAVETCSFEYFPGRSVCSGSHGSQCLHP